MAGKRGAAVYPSSRSVQPRECKAEPFTHWRIIKEKVFLSFAPLHDVACQDLGETSRMISLKGGSENDFLLPVTPICVKWLSVSASREPAESTCALHKLIECSGNLQTVAVKSSQVTCPFGCFFRSETRRITGPADLTESSQWLHCWFWGPVGRAVSTDNVAVQYSDNMLMQTGSMQAGQLSLRCYHQRQITFNLFSASFCSCVFWLRKQTKYTIFKLICRVVQRPTICRLHIFVFNSHHLHSSWLMQCICMCLLAGRRMEIIVNNRVYAQLSLKFHRPTVFLWRFNIFSTPDMKMAQRQNNT